MKVTCKLIGYQRPTYIKNSKWEEVNLHDIDAYSNNNDFEIEYELVIVTVPKKENEEEYVLKTSERFNRDKNLKRRTYIHFFKVSYIFFHDTGDIYCATLEQNI